jgi:hypothetical protein
MNNGSRQLPRLRTVALGALAVLVLLAVVWMLLLYFFGS